MGYRIRRSLGGSKAAKISAEKRGEKSKSTLMMCWGDEKVKTPKTDALGKKEDRDIRTASLRRKAGGKEMEPLLRDRGRETRRLSLTNQEE